MNFWLYLHFPSLQLDSLYAERTDSAIIIVSPKSNSIIQLNDQALKLGIKLGMGLGTASSLCCDLQVYPYQVTSEKEKLREIAQWLYLVTSDIVFFEPNGILLRVSNMLTLCNGLDSYWASLKNHLDQLKLHYYFATGYSALAARILAKAALNKITDNKAWLLNEVKGQPLSASDLPIKTVEKLNRVGINSLGQLLVIPMAEIAKRFDIELINYVGRLLAQFKHPVEFYHPPMKFKHRLELLFDIENNQWLIKPLTLLLTKLEQFLILRDQISHEIIITLHQRDAQDTELTVSSALGDYSQKKWLLLAQLTIESITLNGPVHSITLFVNNAVAKQALSSDLFNGDKGETTALELVSTLQAKLGKQAIKGLLLTEDARPELANQFCQPLTTPVPLALSQQKLRPIFLLPTPQRLLDKVSVIQGPERISTGWWDGNPIVRDYFIARCTQGRWLWIFRNHNKEWFLHGAFS